MKNIFINRPIFAISMAIIMVLLGAIAIFNLAIEQYPNISSPVVEVTATYTGADAETVMSSVATPIAQSVIGVSDMLYMQTTSANDGTMTMQVTFEIGTDPDINTILTQSKLSSATATLPEAVIEQGIVTKKSNDNFLIVYALHSDSAIYDGLFITNYAVLNLQNEILKINGVSDVNILGSGDYAMRVWLDPQKMAYYGVSYEQIESAIIAQGDIYPVGSFGAEPLVEGVSKRYTVTLPPQISSPEEFARIVITTDGSGAYVRLEDVASLTLGSELYDITSRYGSDTTAIMMVYQSVGSNAVEVGAEVKSKMEQLSRRFPEGLKCDTIVDSTTSINAGIEDIFRTLIIALVLVIIIIYLFLQDWRATLIPLIAIPVSLVGAFTLFPVLDFSINVISLLGLVLAIGLVVDDAIVVVEAVQVNLAKGLKPKEAAIEAMRSVTSPIIATTLVLLAVFIPISFVSGISGMLYKQFAVTICFSVLLSAINALTLSPALSVVLLRESKQRERGFLGAFNRWYGRYSQSFSSHVTTVVRHVGRTSLFVIVMLIAIFLLSRTIPVGFLPEEDEGYVMVVVELPVNTPLSETLAAMGRVEEVVRQLPEVSAAPYTAGFNMLAGISQSNSAILFAQLVDYSERKLSAEQIASKLNGMLYVEVPEAMSFAFIPPSIPGLGLASGVTFEVQDLEGRGAEYLFGQTEQIMNSLKGSRLAAQVTTQYEQGVPQRLIDIDVEHAMALGLDIEQIYETLGVMLGGGYISNFNRFGRLYQLYMEAAPEFRRDESALESFTFTNSSSESIPLTAFATVRDTVGVSYVSQFNLYRSIGLTVTPASKVSSSQVMNYVEGYSRDSLPPDIGIAWSGVSYQQQREQSGGYIYLIILLFVFLVLAALYNSWGLPLAILFSVPIAVVGALTATIIMHHFDAKYLNDIYMQISLVMLIGLSAKNAILVVEYAHRNFFELKMPLDEAAIEAARVRLRPILMTAFAFILGVTPLVFASGVYSTARNIMGVALVGGMLLSTLIGVYIYPALFYIVGRVAKFKN
ncbi:MAG: efflux RND transporter permease subunit [Rikenellaceae bacterium]